MSKGSAKNQYLATLFVNFIQMTFGIGCGWPSATIPILESDDSPIGRQSPEITSWMISIMCIGALVGNIFYGWISNIYGRKRPLLSLGVPAVFSWILIIFAQNAVYILIARFLIGCVGGGLYVLIPVFIAEISEDHIRGLLSSTLVFFCNIGILFAFTIGNYCSYHVASMIYLIFPIIFCIGVSFLPETPIYLISVNKVKEAEKSLAFYRNKRSNSIEMSEQYRNELEKLKHADKKPDRDDKVQLNLSDFTNRLARKAFIIGFGLIILNQLCGCFAMINYTATIFKESGSDISPNMSAIVVGALQLAGSCMCTILVEKAGRKFLIGFSALGTGIGLSIFGMYSYFKMLEYDVSSYMWVPIASFSFVICIASWGVLTLPFVIIAEVLPEKIRPSGTSICMCVLWSLSFLALKYFYALSQVLGMHGAVFLFSGVCFLGTLFVMIWVPETKGKTFEEIMKLL